jgi:hypothetical protein
MNYGPLVFLGVALVLGLAPVAQTGSAASSGYVAYSIHASFNGSQQSFSVNETVSPSSSQGRSILSLAVASASTNFTYSHLINSSLTVFPYLPVVTNQSFTYRNDSYSISARITQTGSSQVNFRGETYSLSDYAFYANFTGGESSRNASGDLSVLPSGLVYSISLLSGGTTVTVMLVSTSLPLQASSAAPNLQVASVGVGASVAAAAVALSVGVRARRKKRPEASPKPDHWAD